jgi:hypothetical protein
VVVLDELGLHAGLPGELAGVECLEEKTTAVTENLRLDDQYFRDRGRDDVHGGSLARSAHVLTLAGLAVFSASGFNGIHKGWLW